MAEDLDLKSTFVALPDLTIHSKIAGANRRKQIMFLHGFPEFWYGWRDQIPFFLSHEYGVIVPDQRGYNRSDKPRSVDAYRFDRLVNDIAHLIKQQNCDDLTLVGHDWGGVVACALAENHPSIFQRLVVINAPHPDIFLKYLLTHPVQLARSWYIFLFQLPVVPEWFLFGPPKLMVQGLKLTSSKSAFTSKDTERYKQAWKRKGAPRGMLNWYRALLRNPNSTSTDGPCDIPTLILWGGRDIALNAQLARKTCDQFKCGRLKTYARATHWLHHERTDEVNQAIQEFIGEKQQ